ncbi:MAG TPA: hypothetical protein VHK27_09275, partial [Gammaproteobacteria bacterium]|nr:hypothetical protein [Gammaproteobacteria bacterium]
TIGGAGKCHDADSMRENARDEKRSQAYSPLNDGIITAVSTPQRAEKQSLDVGPFNVAAEDWLLANLN